MKSKLLDWTGFLGKLLMVLIGLAVVAYTMIALSEWSGAFKNIFWFTSDFSSLIALLVLLFAINHILKWLLGWLFRAEFRRRR